MHVLRLLGLFVGLVAFTACGSTEWVNPRKPPGMYAQDYNKCEMSVQQDPKVQAGARALLYKEIDRCMAKEGWLLVEKP